MGALTVATVGTAAVASLAATTPSQTRKEIEERTAPHDRTGSHLRGASPPEEGQLASGGGARRGTLPPSSVLVPCGESWKDTMSSSNPRPLVAGPGEGPVPLVAPGRACGGSWKDTMSSGDPPLEVGPAKGPVPGVAPLAEARVDCDIGVDTLKVRREQAAPRFHYARGAFHRAATILRQPAAREQAQLELHRDKFAPTSWRTIFARERTIRRLVRTAGVDLTPITPASFELIAAALKAGRYRSGASYLRTWERMHRSAGHLWGPELDVARGQARRSIERGIGPAKRAKTVILESVISPDKVSDATDMLIIGCMWMLRGAEAADLLIEQASIDASGDSAILQLGPTKTNPAAELVSRDLRCSCFATSNRSRSTVGSAACPVHALRRVLERRAAEGLSGKHPLFPAPSRRALKPAEAVRRIRTASGVFSLTEHSMRRMGAQFYARRGIPLPTIQFIGRWQSAAVERYVAEALNARASWAPFIAAEQLDLSRCIGSVPGMQASPSLSTMAGLVRSVVKSELGKSAARDPEPVAEGPRPEARAPQLAAEPGALRAVRATHSVDTPAHLIRSMDLGMHPSQWVTHCGWRFGIAPHSLCCPSLVNCKRCCLGRPAQVGGCTDGGAEPPVPGEPVTSSIIPSKRGVKRRHR